MANEDIDYVMKNKQRIINLKALYIEPRSEITELYIIIGTPGIGKTTLACSLPKSFYIKTSNMEKWWEDYNHKEVVIIDDFYGWMSPQELFNLADSKPHRVPVKEDLYLSHPNS